MTRLEEHDLKVTRRREGKKMAIMCYECGKQIKSKKVSTNPPLYLIKAGVDFPKSYHPKCYKIAEIKAKNEVSAINGRAGRC